MWGIIIGAYIALFTMINGDDKKKKKKKYTSSDDVEITTPMMDCVDYHYNKALQLYKNAGFFIIIQCFASFYDFYIGSSYVNFSIYH